MEFSKLKPKAHESRFKKAELHTHSTFSDGSFTPEILAEKCEAHEVKVWALTDHDTCRGCERAESAAKLRGIRFIPGIEISATQGRSVHILGYHVSPTKMYTYSMMQVKQRKARIEKMIEGLCDQGVEIELSDIKLSPHGDIYTRPHLARALVKKGYGQKIQDIFDSYIGDHCPAYEPSTWPSVEEAIKIIHEAGGIAVLAHPGIYGLDESILEWIDAGLDGIEADHPKHDLKAVKRYLALAEHAEIFSTSSSDFHGPDHIGGERFGHTRVDVKILKPYTNL